jgi:hypothetical protein
LPPQLQHILSMCRIPIEESCACVVSKFS